MKRTIRVLAAMLAALLLTGAALAEVTFDGHVVAGEVRAISAPFGGIVDKMEVRAGQPVALGDPVATLATTKVYATTDGTISGVFAKPGDAAEGIEERYGGLVYIEPTHRYIISADNEKAYNSSSTRYVHIGETVYISCVKDGTHTATAVVTSVADLDDNGNTPFKLEVIGGDLYMGETVAIYRSKSYTNESRIGRGTVQQNTAVAIKGTGSVLRMHVKEGDTVERGELLFETVEGNLDGLFAMDNTIVSNVSGIVATVDATPGSSVDKNAKLVTIYPEGTLQIEVLVSELDLDAIHEGDTVDIEYDWDSDGRLRTTGTVQSISHVDTSTATTDNNAAAASTSNSMARYSALIGFEATPETRIGMSVIVYAGSSAEEDWTTLDDGEEVEEEEAEEEIEEETEQEEGHGH